MALSPRPTKGQVNGYDKFEAWATDVERLAEAALPIKGALGNVNLNTLLEPGVYRQSVSANATTANGFPFDNHTWVIEVFNWDVGAPMQRLTPITGTSGMRGFIERRIVNSAQGVWGSFVFVPSQRIDTTVGRAIYLWDNVNHREQLDSSSSSGWRDLTALLSNGWSADKFFVQRVGYELQIAAQNLKTTGGNTQLIASPLPIGFRPTAALNSSSVVRIAGIPLILHENGFIYAKSTSAATSTDLEFSTKAPVLSAWPVTAPGTPIGSIPNL